MALFKWLGRENSVLEKFGVSRSQPYPARARFELENGRLSKARYASGIPEGRAGGRGESTALPMDAGTLALLRKGAPEAIGGKLDLPP